MGSILPYIAYMDPSHDLHRTGWELQHHAELNTWNADGSKLADGSLSHVVTTTEELSKVSPVKTHVSSVQKTLSIHVNPYRMGPPSYELDYKP